MGMGAAPLSIRKFLLIIADQAQKKNHHRIHPAKPSSSQ